MRILNRIERDYSAWIGGRFDHAVERRIGSGRNYGHDTLMHTWPCEPIQCRAGLEADRNPGLSTLIDDFLDSRIASALGDDHSLESMSACTCGSHRSGDRVNTHQVPHSQTPIIGILP